MNLGHRLKLKPRYIWIEFVTQDMDGVGLSFALNIRFHRFHSNSTNQFGPCNTWGAETAQYSGDSGAKQFLSRQSYDLVIVISLSSRTSYATQSFMMFHVRSAGLHQSFGPCNVHGTSSCFKSGGEILDDAIVSVVWYYIAFNGTGKSPCAIHLSINQPSDVGFLNFALIAHAISLKTLANLCDCFVAKNSKSKTSSELFHDNCSASICRCSTSHARVAPPAAVHTCLKLVTLKTASLALPRPGWMLHVSHVSTKNEEMWACFCCAIEHTKGILKLHCWFAASNCHFIVFLCVFHTWLARLDQWRGSRSGCEWHHQHRECCVSTILQQLGHHLGHQQLVSGTMAQKKHVQGKTTTLFIAFAGVLALHLRASKCYLWFAVL